MRGNIKPFPNLSRAGVELAERFPPGSERDDLVVLGIVSAGVPVSLEVAKHLGAALDLVIIRRLLAPRGPGSQACAVNVAGNLVVDDELKAQSPKPQTPFGYFMEDALKSLVQRAEICRGDRPPTELGGKPILLIDCGIRTSLTMQAAINAVRTLNPARITAAVPVTSDDGRRVVEALADDLIYLAAPEPFGNVGVWYRDFGRPADNSISRLLSDHACVTRGF